MVSKIPNIIWDQNKIESVICLLMYIFYQSKKKWSLCYIVPVFEKIYSRKNDTPCFEMNISNLMCTVLVYFNAILCSQSPNNLVISVYRVQKNDLTWEIHLYIYIYVLQEVSYNVWNSFESTYRIFGGGGVFVWQKICENVWYF